MGGGYLKREHTFRIRAHTERRTLHDYGCSDDRLTVRIGHRARDLYRLGIGLPPFGNDDALPVDVVVDAERSENSI